MLVYPALGRNLLGTLYTLQDRPNLNEICQQYMDHNYHHILQRHMQHN